MVRPTPDSHAPAPLWQRLAWFVGLWTASVLALGAVAWVLRRWLA